MSFCTVFLLQKTGGELVSIPYKKEVGSSPKHTDFQNVQQPRGLLFIV